MKSSLGSYGDNTNGETAIVRHILPKANEIVNTAQADFHSIYPFELKKTLHVFEKQSFFGSDHNHQQRTQADKKLKQGEFQHAENKQQYSRKKLPSSLKKIKLEEKNSVFKPIKPTVKEHFLSKYLVYDKFNNVCQDELFNTNIFSVEKLKNLRSNDFILNIPHIPAFEHSISECDLKFDSRFECGNLSMASKIEDTYFLLLDNDVNTSGYTNWFYFSIELLKHKKKFQKKTYKFAILNYGKAGRPFAKQHIGICMKQGEDGQWNRGCSNIQFYRNGTLFGSVYECSHTNPQVSSNSTPNQPPKDPYSTFNTLYFEYEFPQTDRECEKQITYFAYNIPYSYTDLLTTLDKIEQLNLPFYHRKLSGTSLCGNRLEMLTITNFDRKKSSEKTSEQTSHLNSSSFAFSQQSNRNQPESQSGNNLLPVVVLMARSHAGETVGSWILHNFLKFLLSDEMEARALRDRFVFKIFPMINPDGVIHGNYRCSLIGRDLNRRWNKAVKQLYPEVYYIKNQIIEVNERRPIRLVIDLHGHTQKKQAFFFGCNDRNQPHKCRLLPYLTTKVSNYFDFGSCNFCIEKSKLSTARVTLFTILKNCDVFTLETSQFGVWNSVHNFTTYQRISNALMKSLFQFFRLSQYSNMYKGVKIGRETRKCSEVENNPLIPPKNFDSQNSEMNVDLEVIEKEMMQDPNLLRSGNEKDDGSDSEPSVCNIKFQNLTKMCKRKDLQRVNATRPKNSIYGKQNIKQVKSLSNQNNRALMGSKKSENLSVDKKRSVDLLPLSAVDESKIPKVNSSRFVSTSHNFRKKMSQGESRNCMLADSSSMKSSHDKDSGNHTKSRKAMNSTSYDVFQRDFGRKNNQNNQIVKLINFELSFEAFGGSGLNHKQGRKRKFPFSALSRQPVTNPQNDHPSLNSSSNQRKPSIRFLHQQNETINHSEKNTHPTRLDVKVNNFVMNNNDKKSSSPAVRPLAYLYKSKKAN